MKNVLKIQNEREYRSNSTEEIFFLIKDKRVDILII